MADKVELVEIRGTHPGSYRSGIWARFGGTILFRLPDGTRRWCYVVEFPEDNKIDYWPVIENAAGYEFRVVGE